MPGQTLIQGVPFLPYAARVLAAEDLFSEADYQTKAPQPLNWMGRKIDFIERQSPPFKLALGVVTTIALAVLTVSLIGIPIVVSYFNERNRQRHESNVIQMRTAVIHRVLELTPEEFAAIPEFQGDIVEIGLSLDTDGIRKGVSADGRPFIVIREGDNYSKIAPYSLELSFVWGFFKGTGNGSDETLIKDFMTLSPGAIEGLHQFREQARKAIQR